MADTSQPNFHIQGPRPPQSFGPQADPEALAILTERIEGENILRWFSLGGVAFLGLLLVCGVAVILTVVAGPVSILGWLVLLLFYGWMLFAFLHYRHGRQEELWQVLTAAVEAEAPLPQALRAYLRDRPRDPGRKFWTALLLFFVFPGYYWMWYIWNNFDQKVKRLSFLLDEGMALAKALQLTPGVARRETILAAAVGEVTGQTALCLKQAARRLPNTAWIELVPRLLYPMGLLLYMSGALGFWLTYILPRMQRVYQDFHMKLPWLTEEVAGSGSRLVIGLWLLTLLVIVVILLHVSSSTVRWYFPGLGWVYRRDWQGRVLRLLSVLLQTGRSPVKAVQLLSSAGSVPWLVGRWLDAVRADLEQGEPLAPALKRHGLLPAALVPLVQAGERTNNLPRTLGELGEHLGERPIRFLRWFSQFLSLAAVVLLGAMVGLISASMFLPLIQIMEGLSQ